MGVFNMNEKLKKETKQAFLDNTCRIAECTGLSYSTFERIANHFYHVALGHIWEEIAEIVNNENISGDELSLRIYDWIGKNDSKEEGD